MIKTVVAFLLARVEEDEDVARRVLANWQRYGVYDDRASPTSAVRLRAECEAKRRIIARWRYWDAGGPDAGIAIEDLGYVPDDAPAEGLEEAIRALAAVYADHPGYDPAWRLP